MENYLYKSASEIRLIQPSDGYFVSTGDKCVKALCFNAQSLKARDKFDELRLCLLYTSDAADE